MCIRSITGLSKAHSHWNLNIIQLNHFSLNKAYPLPISTGFSFQRKKKYYAQSSNCHFKGTLENRIIPLPSV